jgi:hypothetical protein
MRVFVKSILVELTSDDTCETVFAEVSPSLTVKSAYNEYGVPVKLSHKEQQAIALRIRKRILANHNSDQQNQSED